MKTDKKGGSIVRFLLIAAIVIVLIILAFSAIKYLPKLFSGFGASNTTNTESNGDIELVVSDTEISSGQSFQISWDHESDEAGLYSISYACADDTVLLINTPRGEQALVCNTSSILGPDTNNVELRANVSKDESFTDLPISIFFDTNSDDVPEAKGTVTLEIKNLETRSVVDDEDSTITSEPVDTYDGGENTDTDTDDKTSETDDSTSTTGATNNNTNGSTDSEYTGYNYTNTATKPTYTGYNYTTTKASTTYSVPTGPADLKIVDVKSYGNTLEFTVSNTGGTSSGQWRFNYTTPTDPVKTLESPLQPSLYYGESVKYTVVYKQFGTSPTTITVTIDPDDLVSESSETNNSFSTSVSGSITDGGGTDTSYDPNEDADLKISSMEVGRMSGNTFVEDSSIDEDHTAAIKFTVSNIGGESSGKWKFTINNLPIDSGDDNYESNNQSSLLPGQSSDFIVEIENPDEGDYNIEIEVDSDDDVDEERENNNTDSENLEVER